MHMRDVEIQCFKHRLWRSSRIHRTVVTFVTIVILYEEFNPFFFFFFFPLFPPSAQVPPPLPVEYPAGPVVTTAEGNYNQKGQVDSPPLLLSHTTWL